MVILLVFIFRKQLLEQHVYWMMVYYRWIQPKQSEPCINDLLHKIPKIVRPLVVLVVRSQLKKNMWAQGLGRHSEQELLQLADDDFKALSTALGEKKYFFGDEPTSTDALLHAFLYNFIEIKPASSLKDTATKYQNLVDYSKRLTQEFWSK
jgi:glutathione S-transferase